MVVMFIATVGLAMVDSSECKLFFFFFFFFKVFVGPRSICGLTCTHCFGLWMTGPEFQSLKDS